MGNPMKTGRHFQFLSKQDQRALQELSTYIKANWPQARVKVFGSKIKGTADEESDLDTLIALPHAVTEDVRRQIIHRVFEINMAHGTNLSVLIVSQEEWEQGYLTLLPIHREVEEGGITL
jgi:predicted nucleotidyltransferase